MTALTGDDFFTRRFLWLKLAATGYVVALILSHASTHPDHVWVLAAVFSVAMNATYPRAAVRTGTAQAQELAVAAVLIAMSVAGLVASPLWLVAAIFGHGLWDILKHGGAGVAFFGWYTRGCVVVDWLYAAALLWFFMHGGTHG